jgi:formyltetrahydrofolate hydrolase
VDIPLVELRREFASRVAARFGMRFVLTDPSAPKRVALMVSATTTACSICCGADDGVS